MRKIALAVVFSVVPAALCQTPSQEPDTLRTLLAEVRQLRQDIEAMTVASQRVQIALYSLQMQDAAVARAAQRVDESRNKCRGQESDRQHTAGEVQRIEKALSDLRAAPAGVPGALPADEVKQLEYRLVEMKTALEEQTTSLQTCQSTESEASVALRNEQARLAELQDRIERLDKGLAQLGGAK